MSVRSFGKLAIGAAAFGAAAATVLVIAATSGPSLEAKLGVLGVELSLSIGEPSPTETSPYLEASVMSRRPDHRPSGVDLRIGRAA